MNVLQDGHPLGIAGLRALAVLVGELFAVFLDQRGFSDLVDIGTNG